MKLLLIFATLALCAAAPARASGPAPLTGLENPTLAFGLQPLNDWNTPQPFLNLARTMRPWVGLSEAGKMVDHSTLASQNAFDDAGWVKTLPGGVKEIFTTWRWSHKRPGANTNAGQYVVTYQGEGRIDLRLDAKVTSRQPGRITFTNERGGVFRLIITETDPNAVGDYIRDIVVVREEHEDLLKAGALFGPEWLALIKDARQIRFMDWMRTNGSSLKNWAHRALLGDARWTSGAGAPVEAMVRLANEIGADPWFTMPHTADDDYIRRFAAYVRDHLDPRLKAHVEHSNELWNSSFPQSKSIRAEAKKALVSVTPAELAAKQAFRVMSIWSEVFGSEAANRLVRVFATQTANSNWTRDALAAAAPDAGLLSFKTVAAGFDALAITSYFGGRRPLVNKIHKLWRSDTSDKITALTTLLRAQGSPSGLPDVARSWLRQGELAAKHGLKLIQYEGGQHLHSIRIHRKGGDAFNAFIKDYLNSNEMGDLYEIAWNNWAKIGAGPFMHFTATGRQSKYGSWGLYRFPGDNNPRAMTLSRLNRETKAWWSDRSGAVFQQGLLSGSRTGNGTDEEDYLLGGPSDEVFTPHRGDDGIFGGGGHDVVRLAGVETDYRIEKTRDGHRLTGKHGAKTLHSIEALEFIGGGSLRLD